MSDVATIAAAANAIATQKGTRSFGAPVSKPQVVDCLEFFKGKQPLVVLKAKESALRKYAAGEITGSELPKETRVALSATVSALPVRKYWARKVAAISVAIVDDRKKSARLAKRAAKPATAEPAAV